MMGWLDFLGFDRPPAGMLINSMLLTDSAKLTHASAFIILQPQHAGAEQQVLAILH